MAYISNFTVHSSARRRGLAQYLLMQAEALAGSWGARATGLHCNPANTAGQHLYRTRGYRSTQQLEPPWVPYLHGRAPDRCQFLVKRLPVAPALVAAAGQQ